MRPAGEIRAALRAAFAERGHATWAEVLPACPVDSRSPSEVLLVRRTVENMVRSGELVKAGASKPAGSRAWRTVYELADADDAPWSGAAADSVALLQDVVTGWLDR